MHQLVGYAEKLQRRSVFFLFPKFSAPMLCTSEQCSSIEWLHQSLCLPCRGILLASATMSHHYLYYLFYYSIILLLFTSTAGALVVITV